MQTRWIDMETVSLWCKHTSNNIPGFIAGMHHTPWQLKVSRLVSLKTTDYFYQNISRYEDMMCFISKQPQSQCDDSFWQRCQQVSMSPVGLLPLQEMHLVWWGLTGVLFLFFIYFYSKICFIMNHQFIYWIVFTCVLTCLNDMELNMNLMKW